jgi:ParB-like chromosome segregation protein Spo0J
MKRVLECVQKTYDTIVIPLDDINSVNDNLQDRAFEAKLKYSIKNKGMLNPILICTDEDFKTTGIRKFERRPVPEEITETYRCLIGNNRYKLAKYNGYTHIECLIVRTFDEAKKAHSATQIEPRRM